MLDENLAALDEVAPKLAQRLRWQVDDSHILVAEDGGVSYLYKVKNPTPLPVSISAGQLPGAEVVDSAQPLFLFGLGAGEVLEHYLTAFPERPIVAWERDPSLMKLTLSRLALGAALRSGRLRLLLGVDLLSEVPLPKSHALVIHPTVGKYYYPERFLLDRPLGARRAVVCEGGLFVTDLIVELQQRGFGIYPIDFTNVSTEEIFFTLDRVGPELVASINYRPGIAEFCSRKGCALLCWEIDPVYHQGRPANFSTARSYVFTHRKASVGELRKLGFQHVEQLPLATDPEFRKPVVLSSKQRAHYAAPISYVGNSMVGTIPRAKALFVAIYAHHGGSEADGAALLETVLAEQRKDFSQSRLWELLRPHCRGWETNESNWLVVQASEIAASERRIAYASRLGRFGLQVWGDEGWRQAEPASVKYRRRAGHFTELGLIYCGSQINLDIGRLHQLDIVTMRVFDILACGGFVLAERSEDLETLFEIDREIACYSTLDELEHKVEHYLAHPEEARAIAAAGRQAVLSRHTISKRVGYMLERMGLAGGPARPPEGAP